MTHVLLMEPIVPLVEPRLGARFTVHRHWEMAPGAATDSALRQVRGIAAGRKARVDAGLMDRLPRLEIVSRFGAGYDSIDVHAAAARGIVVTNTPGVLSDEVADLAMGLLIASARRLTQAERHLRDGRWMQASFPLSPTLRGRRVGVVGLGSIGKAIATRCLAFGLSVAYHGRHRQPDVPYRWYEHLVDLARDVDVLMIAAPGGKATHHMIGDAVLDALGPQGIVVNVGRGSIVDQAALERALRERRILGAGLDVFEREPCLPSTLMDLDGVVLTPHVGSCSVHTFDAMGALLVDNLCAYFDRGAPLNPVAETAWPLPDAVLQARAARATGVAA